jgi:hypothetical protein
VVSAHIVSVHQRTTKVDTVKQPPSQPVAWRVAAWANAVGCCRQTVYNLVDRGELELVKVGRMSLCAPRAGRISRPQIGGAGVMRGPPPKRENRPGQGAALENGNNGADSLSHRVAERQAAVREIVARFRREDQRREFEAALDAIEELNGEVYDLVTVLEEPDCDLTLKQIHRLVDRVYGRLVGRITPALKGLIRDGAFEEIGGAR